MTDLIQFFPPLGQERQSLLFSLHPLHPRHQPWACGQQRSLLPSPPSDQHGEGEEWMSPFPALVSNNWQILEGHSMLQILEEIMTTLTYFLQTLSITNVSIVSNEDKHWNVMYFTHYILAIFHVCHQRLKCTSWTCWRQLNSNKTSSWQRSTTSAAGWTAPRGQTLRCLTVLISPWNTWRQWRHLRCF